MDNIGDILFFVLAALFAIVGAVNRKKKTSAKAPAPKNVFDDIEEILTGREAQQRVEYTPVPVMDETFMDYEDEDETIDVEPEVFVMSAEKEGDYKEPMAERFEGEGITTLEVNSFIHDDLSADEIAGDHFDDDDTETSISKTAAERFDITDAIVFSEILKRKDSF
jgi:hypothetical protein